MGKLVQATGPYGRQSPAPRSAGDRLHATLPPGRADESALAEPDQSRSTHGLGGASGLGRPAHAFEEGGAALHRSLERAVRRVRAGGLALRGGTVLPGGVNRGQPDREEAP